MPSNDERREVAARLRSVADKGAPEWATSACCIAECLGEDNYPLWNGSEKLFALLADLIEPEERTCRWVEDENGTHHGECGLMWEFFTGGIGDNGVIFCPNCGARVIE